MNDRITKKERGLLKGAFRRVFSRSELRLKVLQTCRINHFDPNRPRVKNWAICPICNRKVPLMNIAVDHIDPIIPIDTSFEEMSLDVVVDRMWCEERNLQPICDDCHDIKTKAERKQRTANKRQKKEKR